jgi:hypothetical protein
VALGRRVQKVALLRDRGGRQGTGDATLCG